MHQKPWKKIASADENHALSALKRFRTDRGKTGLASNPVPLCAYQYVLPMCVHVAIRALARAPVLEAAQSLIDPQEWQ